MFSRALAAIALLGGAWTTVIAASRIMWFGVTKALGFESATEAASVERFFTYDPSTAKLVETTADKLEHGVA